VQVDIGIAAVHSYRLPSLEPFESSTYPFVSPSSVIEAAVAKGILYGAYDNVLSTVGVSAMWSGVIRAPGGATMVPTVIVDGNCATSTDPENLACPANSIVFFEAGAASKKLSEEEAVQRSVCFSHSFFGCY
jgi:hypothetical protein